MDRMSRYKNIKEVYTSIHEEEILWTGMEGNLSLKVKQFKITLCIPCCGHIQML
jgi:hypothetical protein